MKIPPSVQQYVKHAVAVAASTAVSLGVMDPVTGAVHLSGIHSLYTILLTTAGSLILSYAGLGAPAATKTVTLQPIIQQTESGTEAVTVPLMNPPGATVA